MSATASLGVLGVSADLAIMLALLAAVASPAVSQLARPLIATLAFVCAWLLTAAFDALRAPGWTTFTGAAVMVASISVTIVTVHRWTQNGDAGESGPGQSDDHDGGGPRRHRPVGPRRGAGSGGGDPAWWPEFERQFAFYVANRNGARRRRAEPTGR